MDNEGNEKRTKLRRWKIKQNMTKKIREAAKRKHGPKTQTNYSLINLVVLYWKRVVEEAIL